MTKGTPSMGKRNRRQMHVVCRRCGKHSYHLRKRVCSSCGFGKSSKIRSYNWKR